MKLNITTPNELLDKAFGLSLSDQYWIKPYDSKIEYKDINFFEHDFEDSEFTNATFSNSISPSTRISLISPNNTTDGISFYKVDKFDTVLNYIKDLKRFDLSKLNGICEEFDDLLHKYQNITRMTDRRINKICTLLFNRINKLKTIIESQNVK